MNGNIDTSHKIDLTSLLKRTWSLANGQSRNMTGISDLSLDGIP